MPLRKYWFTLAHCRPPTLQPLLERETQVGPGARDPSVPHSPSPPLPFTEDTIQRQEVGGSNLDSLTKTGFADATQAGQRILVCSYQQMLRHGDIQIEPVQVLHKAPAHL
jgi:hypothetical protein